MVYYNNIPTLIVKYISTIGNKYIMCFRKSLYYRHRRVINNLTQLYAEKRTAKYIIIYNTTIKYADCVVQLYILAIVLCAPPTNVHIIILLK